jgi:tetratricopeptide (TPR) repeat protein
MTEQITTPDNPVEFTSLKDFEAKFGLVFNDEELRYASEILHILNTGEIPADLESRPVLMCAVGNYFDYVKKDYEQAIRYYTMSGDHGHDGYSLAARIQTEHYMDTDAATELYEKELARCPDKSSAYVGYAMLLINKGVNEDNFEDITDMLEKALELGENVVLFLLGGLYVSYGESMGGIANAEVKGVTYMIQCLEQCKRSMVLNVLDSIIQILYRTNARLQPKSSGDTRIYDYIFHSLTTASDNTAHMAFTIIARSMLIFTLPLTPDNITALTKHVEKFPDKVAEITEEIEVPVWRRVAPKYGIAYANPEYEAKVKHHSKLQICDICMSDEQKTCIPVNWCMHYVCTDCYWSLVEKPCPFCRT